MRKILAIITLGLLLVTLPLLASHQRDKWFLGTAVDVGADATVSYPATLPSGAIDVSKYSQCSLTVVFSRAAGTTDTVDVEIWCSPGGGIWSLLRQTAGEPLLQAQTGTDAITGNVVRVTYLVELPGIKYLRLGSVENTDSSNAITGFNVLCSLGTI